MRWGSVWNSKRVDCTSGRVKTRTNFVLWPAAEIHKKNTNIYINFTWTHYTVLHWYVISLICLLALWRIEGVIPLKKNWSANLDLVASPFGSRLSKKLFSNYDFRMKGSLIGRCSSWSSILRARWGLLYKVRTFFQWDPEAGGVFIITPPTWAPMDPLPMHVQIIHGYLQICMALFFKKKGLIHGRYYGAIHGRKVLPSQQQQQH